MALVPERFELPTRSVDKELGRHQRSSGLGDRFSGLFEQYIESDFFASSDNTIGTMSSDDSSSLFDIATSSGASDGAELSADARHGHTSAPAGQGSFQSLERGMGLLRTETSTGADKAAAVEHELLSFDDFCGGPAASPLSGFTISPPPSPSAELSVTKKRFALPIRHTNGAKSPIRKQQRQCSQSPPKMMSPRYQRASHHGAWAKKLEAATEKLSLHGAQQTSAVSPRSSGIYTQSAARSNTFVPSNFHGFDAAALVSPGLDEQQPLSPNGHHNNNNAIAYSQARMTPLTSPTFPLQSPGLHSHPMSYDHMQRESSGVLHTPPPSHKLPAETWNPEPQEFLDYSYPASPLQPSTQRQEEWWDVASAMQPCAQYRHGAANPPLIGLGLEGVSAPGLGVGSTLDQYDLPAHGFDAMLQQSPAQVPTAHNAAFTSPTLLSPAPGVLPSTPITPSTTYLRSSISSGSPTPVTPSTHRHSRSASRSSRQQHRSQSQHHRRKPSKDLSSPQTTAGKKSGARPVSAGFVNFTPDDSRKILTGVAPSGSSKTKARREKEAAEKRRKLSEAARRAVMEAGGDVERLEREGLLASLIGTEP